MTTNAENFVKELKELLGKYNAEIDFDYDNDSQCMQGEMTVLSIDGKELMGTCDMGIYSNTEFIEIKELLKRYR